MKRLVQLISRPAPPSVPAGTRVYAVGDIHGRLDLLDQLLDRIEADDAGRQPSETILIFLGDLVDRGPQSSGVVDRLLALSKARTRTRFIAGNHEQVFLKAAAGDPKALRFLIRIGGRATLLSYGISDSDYSELDYEELARRLSALVPPEHIAFLSSFEDWIEVGDYLFVHAGLRPGVPLSQQTGEDLRWIRSDFLGSRNDFGKVVVHGHTVTEEVEIRPNRIGIDTGAYETGRLTTLALEGTARWFLST